ncbi:MAG: right-handed parallel beta-helix repeat-containing protein [Planctomycetota bacterium]
MKAPMLLRPGILSRRHFLAASAGLGFFAGTRRGFAGDAEGADYPRATSSDDREPDWKERLTMTVGPEKGDVVGRDDKAIQAAVDYVKRLGGGTVRILPGEYKLRNSVYLPSNIRMIGCGADTILRKEPSVTTQLAADSDWYDQEITLADPSGFRVGDGICLKTKNPHNGAINYAKRTLVARSGKRFKLDRALRENYWLMGESTASALFPLITGEEIRDVTIENLVLDGNKEQNELLDGNYAGCLFFQDCIRLSFRGVEARNYNGDGMSWQICHDVVVEDCHSHDNSGLGMHPGSGSQRPIMRNNRIENNDIGIFFCWGVKRGVAEGNQIRNNRNVGVSIGHRDTDNVIRDNEIVGSGRVGVLFRPERGKDFAPHRNRLENNRILDSGDDSGIAVDIMGQTEAIELVANQIHETRGPMRRVGVRIGAETKNVKLDDNRVEGFSLAVADLRMPQ